MKKYLLGLLAILLAVGFSSFKSAPKKSSQTTYYWYDIVNYDPIGVEKTEEPGVECLTTNHGDRCAVGFLDVPSDPSTDTPDVDAFLE
ncbi:MAG TPA: hypothetical protein VLJ68_00305 [Chitinophagaceae bacterium]|nr:hypothetical protein [Chitinophagaceae bacterium]